MWKHIILILSITVLETNLRADDANEEFRGVWVARFAWASADGERCRNNITTIMDAAAENNLNAVVFQVRGAAETLYPSELEPWSPMVGEDGPGFDTVEFAIKAAHQRGLQFHAYVNPMPLRSAGRKNPLKDKRHLWYAHGPDSPEPWICVDEDGNPAAAEYYYLSAGVPGVHVYLRKVILDLVRRYDVDGVHLDRIRYPGKEYSHDAISERRFRGQGNPEQLDRADWQREQLNKLINDLAAEIRAVKPDVVMSCAAWGIYRRDHIDGYQNFSSGYHDYCQDTWNWIRIGAMDLLMPMIYWDLSEPKPNYDDLLHDFIRGVGKDHLVGGQRVFTPEENVRQIQLTRDAGTVGTVLWSYRLARRQDLLSHLKKTLYASKASVPQIPRAAHATHGTILGTARDRDGTPLVDAWVSIEPVDPTEPKDGVFTQTWPTSADGRFAFLKIPPVPVRITVRYRDKSAAVMGPVAIRVREVTSVNAVVGGAEEAGSFSISIGGEEEVKARERSRNNARSRSGNTSGGSGISRSLGLARSCGRRQSGGTS
ncbi:MAG: family 10 glycosylhydrolase [Planctomycetes bacterium]|nr:family 10 glycosylhydrolase [Planctomycetota bacterium]MBL7042410.1 family 10 glycosylhydrolase [Pirellulaceae bacterium]